MKTYPLCAMRYALIVSLALSQIGCDAFVRKFTRKPKKDQMQAEELVLEPQEYKGPQMGKEEVYRQYFLFWKSWQDELILAFYDNRSNKKQIDCCREAAKNLYNLRGLLDDGRQKLVDGYIAQLNALKDSAQRDTSGMNNSRHMHLAERIKRNIIKDLAYPKVKNNIRP
jgi:hypothetical protein